MSRTEHPREPIAVVGMGCRLPGAATDPERLWRLLCEATDAIVPVPADRWDVARYHAPQPQQPGRITAYEGGFLPEIDGFDAAFFGIPRRVAEQMDPQQRLLLEVAWETCEDAGIVPEQLAGSRTGCYIGACSHDYDGLQASNPASLGAHSATGTFSAILANRLSYQFDLRGPSMTLDTACSSALVAVHHAYQSLQRGECDLALAGGVNLMLTPAFGIALSQAGMLSPQARCRAFDAAADGYVRGEGAGIVALKRLTQARADGDRVYALLQGSAVNQDGRTDGITVPDEQAQAANMRAALTEAGIAASEIGYVEAHGTGTPVGDPIEARAIGSIVAPGRGVEDPVWLGSVKTNVGHLEGAAGIAGLLKATLAVYHRSIPPVVGASVANPAIDFEALRLAVPTRQQPWPRSDTTVASVNSFGFGGTNAHVVLGPAPNPASPEPTPTDEGSCPTVLTLSARSDAALRQLAASYTQWLARFEEPDLQQLAAGAAVRRSHHHHRAAVFAETPRRTDERLHALAHGSEHPGLVTNTTRSARRVAFVACGQGPQWWAMARELFGTSSTFAEAIRACDRHAHPLLGWSLVEALTADEDTSPLAQTAYLQPSLFAVQVGLAAWWQDNGVLPEAVAGHSMGEITAAHLSGALDLPTAIDLIGVRARIQQEADPTGGMLYVAVPQHEAEQLCQNEPEQLWVAAHNSPHASTLAGRRPALQRLADELDRRGVFTRLLQVNCACHSPDMDPLRPALDTALKNLTPGPSSVPLYSTVTGAAIDGTALTADYWWSNFRQPVRFDPTLRAMFEDGIDAVVELSPHPVLSHAVSEIASETGHDVLALPSLRRGESDWSTLLTSWSQLYTGGYTPDWQRRHPHGAPAWDLPKNPWIRESLWHEPPASQYARAGGQTHPMLKRCEQPRPAFDIDWNDHRLSWVHDHHVFGSVLVPGSAYCEAALVAAAEHTGSPCSLSDVVFDQACVLDEHPRTSRIELDPDRATFTVYERVTGQQSWTRNAHGRYHRATTDVVPEPSDLQQVQHRCPRIVSAADVYSALRERGYTYGPRLCGISEVRLGHGEALARIDTPRLLHGQTEQYQLHPALLDACLQSALLHPRDGDPTRPLLPYPYLPTGLQQLRCYRPLSTPLWCHTRLGHNTAHSLRAEIRLLDEHGRLVADIRALAGTAAETTGRGGHSAAELYHFIWQPAAAAPHPDHSALTLTPGGLQQRLQSARHHLSRHLRRDEYAETYVPTLRSVCAAYVAQCLQQMAGELAVGDEVCLAHDFPHLDAHYRRLWARLLRMLAHDGILTEHTDGHFRLQQRLDKHDPDLISAHLLAQYPEALPELRLLRRTGHALPAVLTGARDPLDVLFPDGTEGAVASIYATAPISRFYNRLAADAIQTLCATAERPLRVLEVGGGTGGLTASVLPSLPPNQVDWVFTDVSPRFVTTAQHRFHDTPHLRCHTLDLEHDLTEQGFTPGSFDLIVAANAVHATHTVSDTLQRLQSVLAPGGAMFLLEAEPDHRWLELTFGLTTGWWTSHDTHRRPDGPLLDSSTWRALLASEGAETVALTDPACHGPGSQTLLVTQPPDTTATPPATLPSVDTASGAGDWLLVGTDTDLTGIGAVLAEQLTARGGTATLLTTTTGEHEEFSAAVNALLCQHTVTGILQLTQPGPTLDDPDGAAVEEASTDLTVSLQIAQALAEHTPTPAPRVAVLTRGAHPLQHSEPHPAGGMSWGWAAVAELELPHNHWSVLDVAPQPQPEDLQAVWDQLGDPTQTQEHTVAIRDGHRFLRRLHPLPPEHLRTPRPASTFPAETAHIYTAPTPGTLDTLHYRSTDRRAPDNGEVEIAPTVCGLNFLDVMAALGQVPPLEPTQPLDLGVECCGRITRLGADTDPLAVGDVVLVLSPRAGTLASHITVNADCVVPKPAALSDEHAAGAPLVFLTAWYALHTLARLQPGERVLIHTATGATGLAALQLAQRTGATVFATAGTPEKRALLQALGVTVIADSRTTNFVDTIEQATHGTGVDVVLNTLAGEHAEASLACLAPTGRFIELGKRDLYRDTPLRRGALLGNRSYTSLDLRELLDQNPASLRAPLIELLDQLATGHLHPLPYQAFPASDTHAALRHLASSDHLGKIVVTRDEHTQTLPVWPSPNHPVSHARGTWLITGGLGGFGLAAAEHLAHSGADHLVLIGRSDPSAHTQARIQDLRDAGTTVDTATVDVTDHDQLAALISDIDNTMPALRGILHAAMVLDDATLPDLDPHRLRTVLAPKAHGAWHLHHLTRTHHLDAFILISSAASLLGNHGQANYAAANAFLDHLAHARHAVGLPAVSLNLGALAETGHLTDHTELTRHVAATGLRGLTTGDALDALTRVTDGTHPQVAVLSMNWPQFFRHHGLDGPTSQPRWQHVTPDDNETTPDEPRSLHEQLHTHTDPDQRAALLHHALLQRVAAILGMPPDDLDPDMPLMDLIDSLLAVEISSRLNRDLGVTVTLLDLTKGQSITTLVATLLDKLPTETP